MCHWVVVRQLAVGHRIQHAIASARQDPLPLRGTCPDWPSFKPTSENAQGGGIARLARSGKESRAVNHARSAVAMGEKPRSSGDGSTALSLRRRAPVPAAPPGMTPGGNAHRALHARRNSACAGLLVRIHAHAATLLAGHGERATNSKSILSQPGLAIGIKRRTAAGSDTPPRDEMRNRCRVVPCIRARPCARN